MGRNKKSKKNKGRVAPVDPQKEAATILTRIREGRSHSALQSAKRLAKAFPSEEAQTLLQQAYRARIDDLVEQGEFAIASELIERLSDRFGVPNSELNGMRDHLRIGTGQVSALLQEWSDPRTDAARREQIGLGLRARLTDPTAVAQSEFLSDADPLRRGAAAIARAFREVTESELSEDARSELRALSRQSPWAPWKMLILALDAFYSGDDAVVRERLSRVPRDSAVAPLVSVVHCLMEPSRGQYESEVEKLIQQVTTVRDLYRAVSRFKELGRRLESNEAQRLLDDLVKRLLPIDPIGVRRLLLFLYGVGGPSRAVAEICARRYLGNTESLRLTAITTSSEDGQDFAAWTLWFDAVRQERLDDDLLALFFDHLAVLSQRADRSLEAFCAFSEYSEDELLELDADLSDFGDDDPHFAFSRVVQCRAKLARSLSTRLRRQVEPWDLTEACRRAAVELRPTSNRYRSLALLLDAREGHKEACLLEWADALPEDVEPLVELATRAHERKAYKRAEGFIEKATAIDPVHEGVRDAHWKIELAQLFKHARAKKFHLCRKDLARLESLPSSRGMVRRALLLLARLEIANRDGPSQMEALETTSALEADLEGERMKLGRLWMQGQFDNRTAPGWTASVAQAKASTLTWIVGMSDLGSKIDLPSFRLGAHVEKLGDLPADVDSLLALCRACEEFRDVDGLHLVSGGGLSLGGATLARFLFYRASSLGAALIVPSESEAFKDVLEERCAKAFAFALRLARTLGDVETTKLIEGVLLGPVPTDAIPEADCRDFVREEREHICRLGARFPGRWFFAESVAEKEPSPYRQLNLFDDLDEPEEAMGSEDTL